MNMISKNILKYIALIVLVSVAFINCTPEEPDDTQKEEVVFDIQKGINISAWLSQTSLSGQAQLDYFTQADLQRLDEMGFDHIRLPVSEKQLYSSTGVKNDAKWETVHNVISWCEEAGMRVIFDLHDTYSHNFSTPSSNTLWDSQIKQDEFVDLWGKLANELAQYPNDLLAFEILNEPASESFKAWSDLAGRAISKIRESQPKRIILLGSNNANSVANFSKLDIPANDSNIILSFHFYHPSLLTHYQADFTSMRDIEVELTYPGLLVSNSAMNKLSASDQEKVKSYNGTYNKETLFNRMKEVIQIAKDAGVRIHCGEFGSNYKYPDLDLQMRWFQDMVAVFKENKIPYSVWGYKATFGIYNEDGTVKDQRVVDALTK